MKKLKRILLCLLFPFTFSTIHAQSETEIIKSLSSQVDASNKQLMQLATELASLKAIVQRQHLLVYDQFSNASLFMDAAVSSANNLQALISKESYRNKIIALNNPTSGELGFNLEAEILQSLKPILEKTKKTDVNKFQQITKSLLEAGQNSTSLFPTGNIFTCILSLVGNVAINEKSIQKTDLDSFTRHIEKYFLQYEKLYQCNLLFNSQMQNLKSKMKMLQEDIRLQVQDLVIAMQKNIKREEIAKVTTEEIQLKYFNRKNFSELESKATVIHFPQDAIKGCKEIASNIKRTYDEYANMYGENFKAIITIINGSGNTFISIDQNKLSKTLNELEVLFVESKSIDADNLRLKTLFERLELMQQQ